MKIKSPNRFFTQYCNSDEEGISVRYSTKIWDFDCGITRGDSFFVGMTSLRIIGA
ncbi:hypothetical protein [Flavobacterium gilvum]|uniref:hypothetical protein n=1 Tax=Flavobacterium gilvum TaxID=1492737 RepID=UPI0012E06ADB|nr:hypothetical protein [Flavobacterium gilvum]